MMLRGEKNFTNISKKGIDKNRTKVPPHGIYWPVFEPNQHDVLCGSGPSNHPGNVLLRKLVDAHESNLLAALERTFPKVAYGIAENIVKVIRRRTPAGRFLKKEDDIGAWYDIGDDKGIEKVQQALHDASKMLRGKNNFVNISNGIDGDHSTGQASHVPDSP
jgi:hypothetical protein